MAESRSTHRIELRIPEEIIEATADAIRDGDRSRLDRLTGEYAAQRRGSEEERERVVERCRKEWRRREAQFREELARRWRPWATHIRIDSEGAWPSGSVVACAGCGLTTAASTARKALHDVRDCPGCGGDGDDEERGERVHLTRAQKRWECGDCSAAIERKTLYVVLGLRGSPVPKVIGKWPSVRRLCVECWQRIEGFRATGRASPSPAVTVRSGRGERPIVRSVGGVGLSG